MCVGFVLLKQKTAYEVRISDWSSDVCSSDLALAPILNYDFTREGMVRLVEALTHDGFESRDEMIDYRMKYAVRDDVRAAYSATMEWVKSSGGLAWDEDYIRQVSAPTLVVNGDRKSTRLNSSL